MPRNVINNIEKQSDSDFITLLYKRRVKIASSALYLIVDFPEIVSILYLVFFIGRYINKTLTAIFHDEYNLITLLQYKSHRWEPLKLY